MVFSTRKISKIRVSKETFRRIEAGNVTPSETELLTKLGIFVEDRDQEKVEVRDLFLRANAKNPELNLTAVMNLDCNFSCVYCYEGAPEGGRYMSAETADQLVAFIERQLTPAPTMYRSGTQWEAWGNRSRPSVAIVSDAISRLREPTGSPVASTMRLRISKAAATAAALTAASGPSTRATAATADPSTLVPTEARPTCTNSAPPGTPISTRGSTIPARSTVPLVSVALQLSIRACASVQ